MYNFWYIKGVHINVNAATPSAIIYFYFNKIVEVGEFTFGQYLANKKIRGATNQDMLLFTTLQ